MLKNSKKKESEFDFIYSRIFLFQNIEYKYVFDIIL